MLQRPSTPLIGWFRRSGLIIALTLLGAAGLSAGHATAMFQDDGGYTPANGHAQVIAQGVVDFSGQELVWRTVRYSAIPEADSEFNSWPLGFVLATTAPILLTDQLTGNQLRLGPGEATLVHGDTVQRRTSLDAEAAPYMAIELVPPSQAEQNDIGAVLTTWPVENTGPGLHDVDLVRSVVVRRERSLLPGSPATNVLLVTEGTLVAGKPDEDGRTLLAGEAMAFSGELEITRSTGDEEDDGARGVFVAAIIGPAVQGPSVSEVEEEPTADATAQVASEIQGSITIEVFNCPPDMDRENLDTEACSPATEDFDFVISNETANVTLTLADSLPGQGVYSWEELPLGEYRVLEVVLPNGYDTYLLSAEGPVSGDPVMGYTVSLEETAHDISLMVYNFGTA